ncbi:MULTISPECIES: TauD/TfdA family dioxygenase [Chryseobacterium]|uniref:TauD/TfdA family dioxygenase n=1 Tax=Chryseobacterium TaxID=59732 RepID=UPI00195B1B57|nr:MULTISPECIES: TauD/TfdA family dioxygenase [Chryseobacterium]MBM7421639.1 alpha-ketoglutarate-dependent taurine dioxygenase [Chryseobacterium sp. JUb44]MDH6211607.1 alpha-ketoglutarate-dependent taurine dioxygenase [Chryseobacterium sp. BIGb0186]WSO10250.1 TauD/TfdA family dioxygenase [Chryseobacterium scophthalmum]
MEVPDLLINYNWEKDVNHLEIAENLRQGHPLVIIKNFPLSDDQLQSFINHLGVSLIEKRNNNGKDVFDVKITRQNNFFTSIANSNLSFPLHTDCADFDSIPNAIGLLCIEPAGEDQGSNNFMLLNSLLKKISQDEKQKLLNKKWKLRNQERSILSIENGSYAICYDRITMESFSELNNDEIKELNELDKLFNSLSFKIKLDKGDLILFRNDLILHGRDKIDLNSNRLIKRIRFNIYDFS